MDRGKPLIRNDIRARLSGIGQFPLCNLSPVRAPRIGAYAFPLCWRCTGLVIGFTLFQLLVQRYALQHHFRLGAALTVPCAVGGLLQRLNHADASNAGRFVLGFLAGMGFAVL